MLFPKETELSEYKNFKRRKYNERDSSVDSVEMVEDTEDMLMMRKESELITAQFVQEKVVPKIKELVEKSDGQLSGFQIWPQYELGYQPE